MAYLHELFGKLQIVGDYLDLSAQDKQRWQEYKAIQDALKEEAEQAEREKISRAELFRYAGELLESEIKRGSVSEGVTRLYFENFEGGRADKQAEMLEVMKRYLAAPIVGLTQDGAALYLAGKLFTLTDLKQLKNHLTTTIGEPGLANDGWVVDVIDCTLNRLNVSGYEIARNADYVPKIDYSKLVPADRLSLKVLEVFGDE